jgi:hypothetical protein
MSTADQRLASVLHGTALNLAKHPSVEPLHDQTSVTAALTATR